MAKIVPVQLDKERQFYFTVNSIRVLDKKFGIRLTNLQDHLNEDNLDFEVLQALVYAGLYAQDKSLTFEEVGDMIDLENMNDVLSKCIEALTSALPKPQA